MPACNVRLLQPLPQDGTLLCMTGDGGCMILGAAEGPEEATPKVCCGAALPGMPAATKLAAAAEAGRVGAAEAATDNDTEQQASEVEQAAPCGPGTPVQTEQEAAEEGGTSTEGPEFIPESGYRGLK